MNNSETPSLARAARAAWFRKRGDEASALFVENGQDDDSTTMQIVRAAVEFATANPPDVARQLPEIIAEAVAFAMEHRT